MPRSSLPWAKPLRPLFAITSAALLACATPAFAGAVTAQSGFHWGVATAGFQVEGSNPDSNWYRYVQRTAPSGKIDPVNNATDFWNRYEEDIANAAAMGVNTFRLSVEWARIEPQAGQWDQEALAHYDRIIQSIRNHGMTPMITMLHYVYPGWLADQGGFLSPGAVEAFGRFADLIAQRWAGKGTLWVVFNEPIVFFGHEVTIGAAKATDLPHFFDNVVAAHKLGYAAIHRADPNALATTNEAFLPIVTDLTDTVVLDRIRDQLDFIGIDYYYSASFNNLTAIYAAFGQFAKVMPHPVGIYEAIKHFANAFPGKPVYIVENGMPTDNGLRADGVQRSDYLRDNIFWLERALGDGYPVIGYNHWSITDNYEWGDYSSRFGLYQVDILADPSLTRRPTSGVQAYHDIIAADGVADGYRPVLQGALCSLSSPPDSCLRPPSVDGPLIRP